MSLLCKLFGHQPPVYAKKGWWSPGEQYGQLFVGKTDETGRVHGECFAACARCEKRFKVMRVHTPPTTTDSDT